MLSGWLFGVLCMCLCVFVYVNYSPVPPPLLPPLCYSASAASSSRPCAYLQSQLSSRSAHADDKCGRCGWTISDHAIKACGNSGLDVTNNNPLGNFKKGGKQRWGDTMCSCGRTAWNHPETVLTPPVSPSSILTPPGSGTPRSGTPPRAQKRVHRKLDERDLLSGGPFGAEKRCAICGDKCDPDKTAAHIVPLQFRPLFHAKHDADQHNIPSSPNDYRNVFRLCAVCDKPFEKKWIQILDDGTLQYKDEWLAKLEPKTAKKYKALKSVSWASNIGTPRYPTAGILRWKRELPPAASKEARQMIKKFSSAQQKLLDKFDQAWAEEKQQQQKKSKQKRKRSDMEEEEEEEEEGEEEEEAEVDEEEYDIDSKEVVRYLRQLGWRVSKDGTMQRVKTDPSNIAELSARQLSGVGLVAFNVRGDGNCTFRAFADQLRIHGIDDIDHGELRTLFRDIVGSDELFIAMMGISQEQLADFLPGVWDNDVGDLVVVVLSFYYQINLRIIRGDTVQLINNDATAGAPTLTVMYNGDHYQSTRPAASAAAAAAAAAAADTAVHVAKRPKTKHGG